MTKIEMFAALRSIVTDNAALSDEVRTELVAKIDHEVELLTKKALTPSKPTTRQTENVALRAEILEILANAPCPMNIDEIVTEVDASKYGDPVTNGRVSSLLTLMKKDGKVVRTEDKRKAYFAIAE